MSAIVPYIGTIGMGAATALDVAGGLAKSQAQAASYRRNAENAQAETKNTIAIEREKYRRQAESQRAQFAASGVTLDSGTVLDSLAATDADAAVAATELQYKGDRQAADWKNRASTAKINSVSGVGNSLLGGVRRMTSTR